MNKALFLVDDKNDESNNACFNFFENLFAGYFKINRMDISDVTSIENFQPYRLVITAENADMRSTNGDFAAALICFVAHGGGWLAAGKGADVNNENGLETLLGACAVNSQKKQNYNFVVTSPSHQTMKSIDKFNINAKVFQYHFSTIRPGPPQKKRVILFEYLHNMTVCTGGWAQEFCEGRVIGSAISADYGTINCNMYKKIIKQCGLWAAGI